MPDTRHASTTHANTTNSRYSAGQAARITGIGYRTLDHWVKIKFIQPSLGTAHGTGTARAYSFGDLVALRVANDLRNAGISLRGSKKAVRYLQKKTYHRRGGAHVFLVCTPRGSVVEKDAGNLLAFIKRRAERPLWITGLRDLIREIHESAATTEKPARGPASQLTFHVVERIKIGTTR